MSHHRLLLDTHVFLWLLSDHPDLKLAEVHLTQAEMLYVSSASWWEIAIKIGLGKLNYDHQALLRLARQMQISTLDIQAKHTQALLSLPMIHRDPFDRMLIAQSLHEQLPLLTHDTTVAQYSDTIILF